MATTRNTKIAIGAGLAAVLALAGPLIKKWEGVRYPAYQDVVGVWTACYGHTGPDVKPGVTYTRSMCEYWLDQDMREANSYVRRCIGRPIPAPVEAALTSLVFNVGPGPVCEAGRTPRARARAGDWAGTCASLSLYKYAGGRVFRGLVLRRADERALCETAVAKPIPQQSAAAPVAAVVEPDEDSHNHFLWDLLMIACMLYLYYDFKKSRSKR